ncbi:MAG: DedA family protein [Cyanobacteria bacterium P01_F01_bin.150]
MDLVSIETIQDLAQTYGYWAVSLGILLENAGLPIPGETITLVGGFLAGSGELNFWFVLGAATIGAIVGDNFGYWIGAYGGWPLVLKLSQLFNVDIDKLTNVRERFQKNMAQAVIIGRFITLFRIFAGPIAGIVRMPYGQFLLCNSIGAILWATVITSLAFFFGHFVSLAVLMKLVSQFAFVLLAIVALWIGIRIWTETHPQPID